MLRHLIATLVGAWLLATIFSSCDTETNAIRMRDLNGSTPGIGFARAFSPAYEIVTTSMASGTYQVEEEVTFPMHGRGLAGLAVVDWNRDGLLDVYSSNGVGAQSSLFINTSTNGEISFNNIAERLAWPVAEDYDYTGACAADLDNDGWTDIVTVSNGGPVKIIMNLAGTASAAVTVATFEYSATGPVLSASSCAVGDFDADGLVDIVIAHSFDWRSTLALTEIPWARNQANIILRNVGDGRFVDVSRESNINGDVASISWAVAAVDLDQDGDTDIVIANDQGALPPTGAIRGGIDIYLNNGTGVFTHASEKLGLTAPGNWMGLSFGDWDHNGQLDIFATNTGDYFSARRRVAIGVNTTRWFYQNDQGTFDDPGIGNLVATPFGWGTVAQDFNLDGYVDIAFSGSLDAINEIDLSNPGAILTGSGTGFTFDAASWQVTSTGTVRLDYAMVDGDFDRDGDVDLAVGSAMRVAMQATTAHEILDSPFDEIARVLPVGGEVNFHDRKWLDAPMLPGDVRIVQNQLESQAAVTVLLVGGVGIVESGINRSAIGATIRVHDRKGTQVKAVIGGGSFAAQPTVEQYISLANGCVDLTIAWSASARTFLDNICEGQRIVVPQIECTETCKREQLAEYRELGLITVDDERILEDTLRQ